jgi:hypothetical protein
VRADHIEFLVEEASMEAALRLLVPRIIGAVSFEVYPFQCKQNLLGSLPNRLRGYAAWLPDNYRIVVIVDRDDDDCRNLKRTLDEHAQAAGLVTRTESLARDYQIVNRLAVQELEAWFFGDWEAVCQAYPRVNRNIPTKKGFRHPDDISGGTWEALERHLRRAGYFKTGLRKVEAARSITQHMEPARNRSLSFQVFRHALSEMTS